MRMMMEDLQLERRRRDQEKMEKIMKQANESEDGKSNWDDIIDI